MFDNIAPCPYKNEEARNMSLLHLPLMLVIVIFLALGIFSQWLASRIKWPSIVVMAIVGLLVGPIFGLINPQESLGQDVFSSLV